MRGDPDDILRALADPERLAITGVLAQAPAALDDLRAAVDMPVKRLRSHLGRLTAAGVLALETDRRTYRLDVETLRHAAELVGPPRDAGLALGAANEDEEQVLRTFFRNGRLTEIPMKQSKRRIVLERIALEFEPGRHYDEKEVNAIVGAFFNDHAALRRYLVDERFLDRETLRHAAELVGPPREAGLALGAATDDEEQVLRTFFRNGRLTEIPMKQTKRRIVLERIALEFEPGRHYDEREVNAIVGAFFNDHASVRRYLVDEGLLDRDHGVYWRAGGRVVDVD